MAAPYSNGEEWPETLPGFSHISRKWNARFGLCAAKILPGEFYVTRSHEIITTVLGSCISACIRDLDTGVGGMNHFMLPGGNGRQHDQWGGISCLETRYGVAAMESLINEILKQGARKNRLELKLFGGGKVLGMAAHNIGQRNIDFIGDFVRTEGMAVAAKDLGGPHPRKIKYFPRSGKVMVKRMQSTQLKTVAEQERRYENTLDQQEKPGEIDLFD